jgi:hypothetical protein
VTGIAGSDGESAVRVSYLQARRDRAASWALRWAFRPQGGGEQRHLWVRTWRGEKKRERLNGKVDNRVEISKSLHNPQDMPLPPVPHPSPSQNLSPGAYISHPPISSPHIYVHRIIPDLSHWPEYLFLPNPQYSLCTSFSDIDDTLLPVISPGHVTNFRSTSLTHHFRRSHPSRR